MSEKKQIGLSVIGCGVVGRMRATLTSEFPGIGWNGLKPECRPRQLNRVDA